MAKNLEEEDNLPDIDSVEELDTPLDEDTDSLSKLDDSKGKTRQGPKALDVRRAIEDKLEEARLRKELDYLTIDDAEDDQKDE